MSHYGTRIKARGGSVYFDSITDASHYGAITASKAEARENINTIKSRLKMMVAATPKDMFPSDEDGDTLFKLDREFNETWEWLETEMMHEDEAIIAENIVDEWKYDYPDEEEEKFVIDPVKEWERICPHERHEDLGRPMTFDDLKIKDASVEDVINRAQKKFDLNNFEDSTQGKYMIFYNGKLFTNIDGKFLWASEKSARTNLIKAIGLYSNDYIEKEYIKAHPDVLEYFKNTMTCGEEIKAFGSEEVFESSKELFDECLTNVINGEKMDYKHWSLLGHMVGSALNNIVDKNITYKKI